MGVLHQQTYRRQNEHIGLDLIHIDEIVLLKSKIQFN